MTPDHRSALERYANRAAPGSPDGLLARLNSAERDYLSPYARKSTRSGWATLAFVAVGLVVLFGGAVALVSRGADTTQQVAQQPGVGERTPTPTASLAIDPQRMREFEDAVASGWRPTSMAPATQSAPQSQVPVGYEPTDPAILATIPAGPDGVARTPLFDKPSSQTGHLVGYVYPNLGFVPRETADAPGFSVIEIYKQRGICAPAETDEQCDGRPR